MKPIHFFSTCSANNFQDFGGNQNPFFSLIFLGIDISCRSGSQFVDITNLAEVGACPQRGHRFSGAADEGIQQGAGKSRV